MIILLVDDKDSVRDPLEAIIVRGGHQVLLANDGTRALEVLEQNPGVELVLTDYEMPEMNGDQLLRIVREKFPRIIRWIMSGIMSDELKREFEKEADKLAHLAFYKPYFLEVFRDNGLIRRPTPVKEFVHG